MRSRHQKRCQHPPSPLFCFCPTFPSTFRIINLSSTKQKQHETENNNNNVLPPSPPTKSPLPRHIAFICDGNSRWAQSRSLPSSAGHAAGAEALVSTIKHVLYRRDISVVTFYGFSTENWTRSRNEIEEIWTVMERTARSFGERAVREGIRLKILGDLEDERIPRSLRRCLLDLEQDTTGGATEKRSENGTINGNAKKSSSLTVCLAVNYGGRKDLLNVVRRLTFENNDTLCESDISSKLSTSDLPDPDLVIRTGGEHRLSNFLLWESAYSELYFVDDFWPDFDESALDKALDWYAGRSRRYGGRTGSDVVEMVRSVV